MAWEPLGWSPQFFAENDPQPSRVLAHHFPGVPNFGDLNEFKKWPEASVDVLAGGTPCQSFSIAGLRAGLADPRGNLALVYLAIAERYNPDWLVWENVTGVLSSNGGRDFGSFVGALVRLGYSPCWRVFDAQYFGVPQRRRRVFLVAHFGDWRAAASVLFEPESLQRNPPPSRGARQGFAGDIAKSLRSNSGGIDREDGHTLIPDVANPLTARMHKGINTTADEGQTAIVEQTPYGLMPMNSGKDYKARETDVAQPVLSRRPTPEARQGGDMIVVHGTQDPDVLHETAHTLGRNSGQENAVAETLLFDPAQITCPDNRSNPQPNDPAHTLAAEGKPPALVLNLRGRAGGNMPETEDGDVCPTIRTGGGGSGNPMICETAVRRLTPTECERLQGFPDGWTALPKMSDTARYRMLGNSMAVPVMRWIGQRIHDFEEVQK